MLNLVWIGLIVLSVVMAGVTGHVEALGDQAIIAAKTAVEIVIGLLGGMVLWLGIMRLGEKAGLIEVMARAIKPLMKRLFPEVPGDHPAMGAMIMNMAANILGIGNAATPFGLRAMHELQKLNRTPGVATNAMCMFLAINTSSIQAIPANTVALLAAAGSVRPSAIIGTGFVATVCSTIVGILSAKLFASFSQAKRTSEGDIIETAEPPLPPPPEPSPATRPLGMRQKCVLLLLGAFLVWMLVRLTFPEHPLAAGAVRIIPAAAASASAESIEGAVVNESSTEITVRPANGPDRTFPKTALKEIVRPQTVIVRLVNALSSLAIPGIIVFFVVFAALKGVNVYESFIEGAKEGFNVVVSIIPYAVGMLVVIFMFRASGGIDALTSVLRPILGLVGFPPEILPMALIRPLSTSGANAVLMDLCKTFGPDHLLSRMGATIMGSTETTFYVVAVYFGAVGIRRTRYALAAGLLADFAGVVASVVICKIVFQ